MVICFIGVGVGIGIGVDKSGFDPDPDTDPDPDGQDKKGRVLMSDAREPVNTGNPSIRIPKAVAESLNAPPCSAEFAGQGMTGAQVLVDRKSVV